MNSRRFNGYFLFCIIIILPIISGCLATSREMIDLSDEIYNLRLKLNEVQQNQADISAKMDNLNSNIKALNYELEDNKNRMSMLGQRLDDVESNMSQRMNKLSEQLTGSALKVSPPPSEIYKIAYSDFSRGKFKLAIVGFKTYLDKFPQGEVADQAQYYIAESYYSLEEWGNALPEFSLLEKKHPQSSLVASSRFKQALSLEKIGDAQKSRDMLRSIMKDFPNSPEAMSSKEKLEPADK